VRDIGKDGIFRDTGLDHEGSPYAATRRYFGYEYGLENWIYAQKNHPDHFHELVKAQQGRDERRLLLVVDSPSDFIAFGWLEGLWSQSSSEYELSFCQWFFSQSKENLRIHCDATKNLRNYQGVVARRGSCKHSRPLPSVKSRLAKPAGLGTGYGHLINFRNNFLGGKRQLNTRRFITQ
jgi:hypothetical protein